MDNDNKQIIIDRIWSDPAPIFGDEWKQTRNRWTARDLKISLIKTDDGESITVCGNHGSHLGGEYLNVFPYLQYKLLNTSTFGETLQRCAKAYGLELKLSAKEAQKIQRLQLAREVAASFVSSLMENTGGAVREYLKSRGFEPDGRHFGELTTESIKRAKEALKARNLTYNDEDLEALGITDRRVKDGYNLVLPYYHNGNITGLKFRDITGTKKEYKYLNSDGIEINGYCDQLTQGKPAIIVEGEMDALRLMSAGATNVISMGGSGIGDKIPKILKAYNIVKATYIPDVEYKQGERETELLYKAIKGIQSAKVEGEQVIKYLSVADLPTPQGTSLSDYKADADSYGRDNGNEALCEAVKNASDWWEYELDLLEGWIREQQRKGREVQRWEFESSFRQIYERCSPIERESLRQNIDGVTLYVENGITRAALMDIDEWNRQTQYTNRIKASLSDLQNAVNSGANPVKIGEILAKMREAQETNTREDWERQLNMTWEEELKELMEQKDTLETKWQLGKVFGDRDNKEARALSRIEYFMEDITVFCAPTSHGKTMILFQSAIDLLIKYPSKTFLYVSCEENKRQLLERSFNVFLDIETTKDGRSERDGSYCFIENTRKKALKAILRNVPCPYGNIYSDEHWDTLRKEVNKWLDYYETNIFPRLKLIYTEGSAESIAENIRFYTNKYMDEGEDVAGVFVDYMQLLTSDNNSYSRHDELKDICKVLKDCATQTGLAVIIAAQLNRDVLRNGLDSVTLANIGEGADIERIAHDVFLIWQVDKTKRDNYVKQTGGEDSPKVEKLAPQGDRSCRIFEDTRGAREVKLKEGFLYIEQMKARDGITGGWGLYPFNGERGSIGLMDKKAMEK